jgi:hypothetical protein
VNVAPGGTGLTVTVRNPGSAPLRIYIQDDLGGYDADHRWCVNITSSGREIAWSELNTECWNGNSGADYAGEPINTILFLVPSSTTTDTEFDFCIENLAPVGADCPTGAGGAEGAG